MYNLHSRVYVSVCVYVYVYVYIRVPESNRRKRTEEGERGRGRRRRRRANIWEIFPDKNAEGSATFSIQRFAIVIYFSPLSFFFLS